MKQEDPLSAAVRRRKRKLVRDVMGEDAFDPWRRLDAKAAAGLDISVEASYLKKAGIKRKKRSAARAKAAGDAPVISEEEALRGTDDPSRPWRRMDAGSRLESGEQLGDG